MKRTIALVLVCTALTAVAAQGRARPAIPSGVGLQAASDGSLGVVFHAANVEAAITAQAILYDFSASDATYPNLLQLGASAAYLFRQEAAGTELGVGVAVGTGIGLDDVEYDEYIDLGPRISFNVPVGARVYATGAAYPFWMETRDVSDVEDDWSMTLTVPRATVGLTVLF